MTTDPRPPGVIRVPKDERIAGLERENAALRDEVLSLVADLIGENWCFFCGWTPTHRDGCRIQRIMREQGVAGA